MTPNLIDVPNGAPVFTFSARTAPVVSVAAGSRLAFRTGDQAYLGITGPEIDAGTVDFQRVNALVGPVAVEGAEPGDALGFRIESIQLGQRAFALYVARWRARMFGMRASRVVEAPIVNGAVELGAGVIQPRPMVGCCGVAPARGAVSGLSPTAPTGGNMDLVELAPGTTIWFPVRVPGALFSLGDVHARMGRGEPLGSGMECAATVVGTVLVAPGQGPAGPVLVNEHRLAFVGTSAVDEHDARTEAVRAAWDWLTRAARVPIDDALAIAAALLEIDCGGPAGFNVVASFERAAIAAAGVTGDCWPLFGDGTDPS